MEADGAGAREVGTVTVMFTDLAGSTAMRARLGEEAADRLRGVHDAILTDAITTNGGRVVKHLGDGFMAAFPSAAGAVSAAVALQQEIDRANRRGATEAMRVRVGISTGDVSFEGGDCFGLPVVEAQRLEASAEPGTIRCAEMVKLLARGRGGHEFVSLGELELKGSPSRSPPAKCGGHRSATKSHQQTLNSAYRRCSLMPAGCRSPDAPKCSTNSSTPGSVAWREVSRRYCSPVSQASARPASPRN